MGRRIIATFLLLAATAVFPAEPPGLESTRLGEAVQWIRATSLQRTEYDYVMTARVRLLLFWVGKDDVGGGYIRYGTPRDGGKLGSLAVLFGSDPDKAPRKINRWGAATEILHEDQQSSAFFGFMKASKGKSVSEMQSELSSEQAKGQHFFEAIVSRVDKTGAISRVVPFYSDEDFTLHQFDRAESMVMEKLSTAAPSLRKLDGAAMTCAETAGFLFAVQKLIDATIAGKTAPLSTCYTYNARLYAAKLTSTSKVADLTVRFKLRGQESQVTKSYHDLTRARFEITRQDNGARTTFELVYGNSGDLKGVPVQITHQPNWWFKVILNLLGKPDSPP